LNSKSNLLDFYFDNVYQKLKKKILYKGIDIGHISTKFFIGKNINNVSFINKIDSGNLVTLVDNEISSVEKITYLIALKNFFQSIIRFFYYSPKNTQISSNIYFFISNPKFIKFFENIRIDLDRKEIDYAYIFWDKRDIPIDFPFKKIILEPSISSFFVLKNKPNYLLYNSVDRFISTAKKIKGSKVLIPEGCLSSMHIIAELGRNFHFETICIQWGFFGKTTTKAGWRHMPYNKLLVWGDFFKYHFSKYNDLNIVAAGHPNLDISHDDINKRYILIAIQKELGDHITLEDVKYFLKNIFAIIEAFPDEVFIIRTHPDLPYDKLPLKPKSNIKNIVLHEYNQYTLNESFRESKICIGISSTTVIESVALNCYPVYVKANSLPLQIHEVFNDKSNLQHVFEFDKLAEFIHDFDYKNVKKNIIELKKELFTANSIIEEILK
jgi:hypothetical protein